MRTTRRTFLAGIAAASVPAVAVATPAEDPADRVERLGYELADAMNEFAAGKFRAVVYPSELAELPVSFQKIAKKETQEQKCARLLLELMDECRKLPLPLKTRFGDAAQIDVGGDNHVRYGYSETGGQTLVVVLEGAAS